MSQPVPRDVTRVRGCTCAGSTDLHSVDCALLDLTEAEYWAAVDESRARLRAYVEVLNGRD